MNQGHVDLVAAIIAEGRTPKRRVSGPDVLSSQTIAEKVVRALEPDDSEHSRAYREAAARYANGEGL